MRTYPIVDQRSEQSFAFEIENAYVRPGTVARILGTIDGVRDVRPRKPFSGSSDIQVEFKYLNCDCVVWEAWGDNSRYWIGPKQPEHEKVDIRGVEDAFKSYAPPLLREVLGDVLSLRIPRVFKIHRPDQ